ncbi:MAG: hypothetical protein RL238_407 [Actinomycetota bacterium]|jgi:hypothetical protein
MTRRRVALLTLGTLAALASVAACRPVDAETGTNAIGQASELQCNDARRTVEQAVDNYEILEGHLPRSESALVPGYLVMQSALMDIDAEGHVVPAPGSGCR